MPWLWCEQNRNKEQPAGAELKQISEASPAQHVPGLRRRARVAVKLFFSLHTHCVTLSTLRLWDVSQRRFRCG